MLAYKNPKAKPCEVCPRLFVPEREDEKVCSNVCGLKRARLLIAAVVAAALSGCGPTCEEMGGKHVFSHFLPMATGKTMLMIPQYRCVGAQQ
jgi:hypothetical protein